MHDKREWVFYRNGVEEVRWPWWIMWIIMVSITLAYGVFMFIMGRLL